MGDAAAYAASGPAVASVQNADLRVRGALQMVSQRIVYYGGPDKPLAHALKRVGAARSPLRAEVSGGRK